MGKDVREHFPDEYTLFNPERSDWLWKTVVKIADTKGKYTQALHYTM